MTKLLAILGIIIFIGVTYLFSKDKKNINWKQIGVLLATALVMTFVMIKTPLYMVIQWVGNFFSFLIEQSTAGISFVFGGLTENYVFFLNGLLPIVFISAFMGILFHFGILQKLIEFISKWIARLFKIDGIVVTNAITNMFIGQSESLFPVKSYLPNVKDSVVFATLVLGMSTVSVSVFGLYQSYSASIEYILMSVPLNIVCALLLTQIFMPTKYDQSQIVSVETDKGLNVVDTMMNYAFSGFRSVVGIVVSLIAFLSLVQLINSTLGLFNPELSLQSMLGVVYTPISALMGIPLNEVPMVAELMGTKIVTNEAVAYSQESFKLLSENTRNIATIGMTSFAGFGSVGILLGAYGVVAPSKSKVVVKLGFQALLIATLVSFLSAAIVSLFL